MKKFIKNEKGEITLIGAVIIFSLITGSAMWFASHKVTVENKQPAKITIVPGK